MKIIREIILFIKFCQNEFSYEKPKFYGIKDECCTDENIFFYCCNKVTKNKYELFFYQCRICMRLFYENK